MLSLAFTAGGGHGTILARDDRVPTGTPADVALNDATVANFARAGRMVNDAGFRLGLEFLPTLALVSVEIISEPLRALGHREFARRAHDTAAAFWR